MTVLGFHVTAPDRAFAWCDSEVFSGTEAGVPAGHVLKMGVHALGNFVIVGTGRIGPFRDALDAVVMAQTFDDAIAKLPDAMRLACRAYSSEEISARAPLRGQTIAAVGFSHSRGAIVGATFDLTSDFEPVMPRRQYLSPAIDGGYVADHHSAISVADRQLVALRRQIPDASGGVLILAEITPSGINCRPLFDFTKGCLLSQPPALVFLPDGQRSTREVTVITPESQQAVLGSVPWLASSLSAGDR
jgi:hypothetical protein